MDSFKNLTLNETNWNDYSYETRTIHSGNNPDQWFSFYLIIFLFMFFFDNFIKKNPKGIRWLLCRLLFLAPHLSNTNRLALISCQLLTTKAMSTADVAILLAVR